MGGMPDRVGYDGKHPWNAERPAQSGMTPHAKLKNEQNADCRKRGKEVFNHLCNCVKMRDLACEKFGRKCCKILQIMFVIQKFLLPLQPNN